MYDEKLSIIIPTRNRQFYAFKCITTLLNLPSDKFEIIVQDNSDEGSLQEMLGDRIDGVKLKYAYSNECLSFCSNFERGIELSSGDYIIMIGDDDCVFPSIIELTNTLREKKIDAAVFTTQTTYIWPNAVSDNGGKLVVRKRFNYIKKMSTASALTAMVASGNYDYQKYPFPKIYHGIVKREKFDLVKAKTGHYFGGLTPDIYSAVSLSFYIDNILYVNTPFTLPGTCAKSGSADSLTGRHTGELKEAPHFKGHDRYEWDEAIPYVYSVDTIWAETAFKAIKENGKNIALTDVEYFAFLSYIAMRSPMFQERMADFFANQTNNTYDTAMIRIKRASKQLSHRFFIKKSLNFGTQILMGRKAYTNINDIEMALITAAKDLQAAQEKAIKKIRNYEW